MCYSALGVTAMKHSESPRLYVAAGASAGGLEAFRAFVGALEPGSDMAYLLVQHLSPEHESLLPELLATHTTLTTVSAEDGVRIEPDTVYVIPAGVFMEVVDGTIRLTEFERDHGLRLPINHLFASLASDVGPRAVAIVLTGTGRDGTAGLREIRAAEGLAIAQEVDEAEYWGMPSSAIDEGVVDLVCTIDEIPAALKRFAELNVGRRDDLAEQAPEHDGVEDAFERLRTTLVGSHRFDLGNYKDGTLLRRLQRRMVLSGASDIDRYVEYCLEHPEEQVALKRDLLISVTEFFRDPDHFDELRAAVVAPMIADATDEETLRVWIPACATGEEAYSVVITLLDEMERAQKQVPLQVFATDIDTAALEVARRATYPASIAEHVSAAHLARYFKPREGVGFEVRAMVRDCISFAEQDICEDPPFSRMDLVSCRNLLIYLRADAQEQALQSLHYALAPGGVLFLGSSESTQRASESFAPISGRAPLFRKVGVSSIRGNFHRKKLGHRAAEKRRDRSSGDVEEAPTVSDIARGALIEDHAPPSVVVSDAGEVVWVHGDLGLFLRFPQGIPRLDFLSMLHPDLSMRARTAIFRCRSEGEPTAVSVPPTDEIPGIRLRVRPVPDVAPRAVLVSFQPDERHGRREHEHELDAGGEELIRGLERELAATREDLRHTVVELETSNEELRSANEESMSMNEELQSANEELEATSEELRSLNEELTTVNRQLRAKIQELERTHDDLRNFFASTRIATLFLGMDLRIQRLTPHAVELLTLDSDVVGRFVGDIARDLLQHGLEAQAREVLRDLKPISSEIQLADGRWVERSVLPYRTESQRIEGVVVTLVDITDLKIATHRLGVREKQQRIVARLGLQALEARDLDTFVANLVHDVRTTLDADLCEVFEVLPGERQLALRAAAGWRLEDHDTLVVPADSRSQLGRALTEPSPVATEDLTQDPRFDDTGLLLDQGARSGVTCRISSRGETYGILGAHRLDARLFSEDEQAFLHAVSSVIASAVMQHQTQRMLHIETEVARRLAASNSLPDALDSIREALSTHLPSDVCVLWMNDSQHGDLLRCRASSFSADVDERPLRANLMSREIAPGEGFVGRVYATGAAEATAHLGASSTEDDLAAHEAGLRFGLAFSLIAGHRPLGVLAFYGRRPVHVGDVLLRAVESIGRAVGDYLHRQMVESKFRATFHNAAVGIGHLAFDGRILRGNERLHELLGASDARDLEDLTLWHFLPPDDGRKVQREIDLLVAEKRQSSSLEHCLERPDAEDIWVQSTLSVVRNGENEPDYLILILEDISARKSAEDHLQRSEWKFRQILTNSPIPMMAYDREGEIVEVSRSWVEAFGYSAEEIADIDSWLALAFPDEAARVRHYVAGVWDTEEGVERNVLDLHTRSGERRTVLFHATHLGAGPDGRELCVWAAADVTPQRRAEQDLREADRQKDQFLAVLGHELLNPLAAVQAAAKILGSPTALEADIERARGILGRQTEHMGRLIEGLLDVSRIIRGKIDVTRERIDLAELVTDVVDTSRAVNEEGALDFVTDVPSTPVWIEGDRIRLAQIVDNLLTNAIKHTDPPGRIFVTVNPIEREVEVTVRDEGSGIPANLLPHVFQMFRQADQELDRARGGLGLGLSLSRALVELHDGKIEAHSEGPGRGAEFVVTLPLAHSRERRVPREATGALARSWRIALIEDNEDLAQMLSVVLREEGHEVSVAHTGNDGVELVRDELPDLVLCDIGLPDGMSGYDVARQLRDDSATEGLLMLSVSGYGRASDRADSEAAGFDAHLTKPLDFDVLWSTIDDILSQSDPTT